MTKHPDQLEGEANIVSCVQVGQGDGHWEAVSRRGEQSAGQGEEWGDAEAARELSLSKGEDSSYFSSDKTI